jgi:Ran GTPase-activating protein (RanGAP) involved in mRNA processing and transport
MEIIATALFNNFEVNPVGVTRLRILNLSRNVMNKEGAKILAPALEGNKSLQVLDLSQCKIGVSGT